jgi:hypothetical protein
MTEVDLHSPRSIGQIIDLAVIGHLRHPLLFLTLALSVVAPYTLIVLAATGASPLTVSSASTQTILTLELVGFAFVGPMVSVLHVHALAQLGAGGTPTVVTVYRPAVRVVAVAAAAQIVAGVGIGAGLLAFVLPGIFLLVRLAVVAQVASIDRTDWIGALKGSFALTNLKGWHVFGAVLVAAVFELAVTQAGHAVAGTHTHAPQVLLAIVVGTVSQSFTALVLGVLYYDLKSR